MNNYRARLDTIRELSSTLLHDSELYRILSRSASSPQLCKMLESFAEDCSKMSGEFTAIFRRMTGTNEPMNTAPVKESGSLRSVMNDRIFSELKNAAGLRKLYFDSGDIFRLKRACFNAMHDAYSRAVALGAAIQMS